jgi:hypothetical protein
VNGSSVLGALACRKKAAELDGLFDKDGFTSCEWKIDGLNSPSYRIESAAQSWVETQKLFSSLFNVDHTGSQSRTDALGTKFIFGVSWTRFHEGNLSMVGTPIANQIQLVLSGNTAGNTMYLYLVREHQLLISATGDVQTVK